MHFVAGSVAQAMLDPATYQEPLARFPWAEALSPRPGDAVHILCQMLVWPLAPCAHIACVHGLDHRESTTPSLVQLNFNY